MNIQASGSPRPKRGAKSARKQRAKQSRAAKASAKAKNTNSSVLVEEPSVAHPVALEVVTSVEVVGVEVLIEAAAVAMPLVEDALLESEPPRPLLGAASSLAEEVEVEALLVGPADAALEDFPEPIALPAPTRAAVEPGVVKKPAATVKPKASESSTSAAESATSETSAAGETSEATFAETRVANSAEVVDSSQAVGRKAAPRVVVAPDATASETPAAARAPVTPRAARTAPLRTVAAAPAVEKRTFQDLLLRLSRDEHKWLAVGLFAMVAGWIVVNSGWAAEKSGYPMMLFGLILPVVPYLIQHYLGRQLQIRQVQQTLAMCEARATRQGNNALVYELRSSDFRRRR